MVMDSIGSSLKGAFRRIAGLSHIDKETVDAVVRDVQRALIQADVDVAMVSELSKSIRDKVLDSKLPPGMSVKELFIKVLYEEMVRFLGEDKGEIALKKQRILVVGLFASGKTTSIGKLAKWFRSRGLSVGLAACDTHRPAAQDQLVQLAAKSKVPVYREGKKPEDIARNALKAKEDVLIFDTAGRDALDNELARELKDMAKIVEPDEVLLVIPADIGQVAREQAEEFNRLVGITGIIVTRLDGTGKAGGALSAAAASGARVKFIGTGEKPEDFEVYDPKRFVSRITGYGDIQGLLDKAREAGMDEGKVKEMLEGSFDMNTFLEQIKSMKSMGSLSKVMEMIPGGSGLKIPKGALDVQEDKMKQWEHIILSMTPVERKEPEEIRASRIKRIARGAGASEASVRDLLKHYKQARKIMKYTKGGKGFKRGPLAQMAKQLGMG